MRQCLVSLMIAVMVLLQACSTEKTDYELIATFQDHTVPEADVEATDSTRVLIVVPHADDETIAGGLIALLKAKGASIHLLTLCGHNALRTQELACAAAKLGIEKVETAGFVNNTWEAIMQDRITFWYDHQDSIQQVIAEKVTTYDPHILVT
ncbi:MAG: PIG-L family deacetylase [Bacteroidales bacterium]